MNDFAASLLKTFGADVVTLGDAISPKYRQDWAALAPVLPLALARPRDTAEVSALLAACHAAGVPVVPQGGLTGVSGAAHPDAGGIALSLERLNRIEAVDADGGTLTAGAGVILETAQNAAQDAGLMLGIDIGARGSCQLGGVLATNAGGNTVIRYGMARDHVLGLEVVLADGTVINGMNALLKNNAGLDLKQLFIGSEGLLGVITRCVLRLHPQPAARATAFLGCADTTATIALLRAARGALGPMLSSFEVMWPSFFHYMSRASGLGSPLAGEHGAYVIIEATGFDDMATRATLEDFFDKAFAADLVEDGVLAGSTREERAFWAVRESPADYEALLGPVIPFDVGIPIAHMAEAVARIESEIPQIFPTARVLSYGHIGDSNLHVVVNLPEAGRNQPHGAVKATVYRIVGALGGTVSAEHGIGLLKRDYLGHSRTATEITLMRQIKKMLDPKGILNPGKSFDQEVPS
ncbi:FAD-binding oxidoreductase [Pseudooceanicola algae]|uniref:Putative FAD-linked oxidoreductase n=1 Tax=Pseudooceanicola algae TaxID=1537215 RepID=A0A418SKZ1_9RHOB|nr:FAD-binding oxidoreductase [Pseudooceanicola algae]QPM90916.1 putative FAD-linked oxidoreductase [Pseudooceanicola algae]